MALHAWAASVTPDPVRSVGEGSSIPQAAGFRIATRDVGGFEGCGLEVINPWDAAAV